MTEKSGWNVPILEMLRIVSTFPQTERKWICAMLAFSNHSLYKSDTFALELMETMAKYADGIITRPQVAAYFEASMRRDGIDVTFDYGKTVPYLSEALESGTKPQTLIKIIHDIFGNPFRPVTIDASWLTPKVNAIAQKFYTDRTFDQMPLLADELENAGCDNKEILGHFRGPGPHVRGCWALDLVLGKE